MKDLIEAFTILSKYTNTNYPTHCEHDVMYVPTVDYNAVSVEDRNRLEDLGFYYNNDGGEGFMSHRFGSC